VPWSRKEVRFLFSKASPMKPDEKAKMAAELHSNPALGHGIPGSPQMKRVSARRKVQS
jgi:hypothetical protein